MIGLIRKFFADRRSAEIRKVIGNYNTPLELATFYNNGATSREKKLVNEYLRGVPDRYKKEVEEHIEYLSRVNGKASDLERKSI